MILLSLFLASCGAEPPPASEPEAPHRQSSPPPVATGPREAGRRTAPADWVVADWAALQTRLVDVYLARVETRTTAGGTNAWCIRPSKSARGRRPLPGEICTAIDDVVGPPRAWESIQPEMWVATQMNGSIETIAALAANDCGGSPCADAPGDKLTEIYRCGQLERVWSDIPPEHLACFEDRACVLVQTMCFETAIADRFVARYQDVVARHGGPCLDPRSGACPASEARPVCREGRCAVQR